MSPVDRSLKPGWTRVEFGDVARLNTDRASDPEAAGFSRYVGLEHIDPGNLTIRRWGDISDGTTFTNVFRPGQVLFGKRRAYQRKVAVPDFSGVCSGDIYVLESKDDRHLLPELLPFVCQTDAFFEHAVGTSVGSLSPRTNWQSLATYEFALPPLDEQRRLARTMVEILAVCDTSAQLNTRIEELLCSVYTTIFDGSECQRFQLKEVADVRMGRQRAPRHESGSHVVPYLRAANIRGGKLDLTSVNEMNFNPSEQKNFGLRPGDVLISEGCGSRARIGDNAVWNSEISGPVCFQNTVIRVRARKNMLSPELLKHWARYAFRSGLFQRTARGTSILHIGHERCEQLPIFLPATAEERDRTTALCEFFENTLLKIRKRVLIAIAIRKHIETTNKITAA